MFDFDDLDVLEEGLRRQDVIVSHVIDVQERAALLRSDASQIRENSRRIIEECRSARQQWWQF